MPKLRDCAALSSARELGVAGLAQRARPRPRLSASSKIARVHTLTCCGQTAEWECDS